MGQLLRKWAISWQHITRVPAVPAGSILLGSVFGLAAHFWRSGASTWSPCAVMAIWRFSHHSHGIQGPRRFLFLLVGPAWWIWKKPKAESFVLIIKADRICSAPPDCLLQKPHLSHVESFRRAGKTRSCSHNRDECYFRGLVEAEIRYVFSFSSRVANAKFLMLRRASHKSEITLLWLPSASIQNLGGWATRWKKTEHTDSASTRPTK